MGWAIRTFGTCAGMGLALGLPLLTVSPLAMAEDRVGTALGKTFVSTSPAPSDTTTGACAAFRRRFTLNKLPKTSTLHLFADARYIVWINGQYAGRGPARFEPGAPEYDSLDVTPFLRRGVNSIAVLVAGRVSNGQIRWRPLGLTAQLVDDGWAQFGTDAAWYWSDKIRYRSLNADWASLYDVADARVEDGDWTQPGYDDSKWSPAAPIKGAQPTLNVTTKVGGPQTKLTVSPLGAGWWGPLSARRTPLLRETPVSPTWAAGTGFPLTLSAGGALRFDFPHLVLATTTFEVDADAGSEIELDAIPGTSDVPGTTYVCHTGVQSFVTTDAHPFASGVIRVKSGRVTIRSVTFAERLYPFTRVGRFASSDPFLDKLWTTCVRGLEIDSQDAYVDCADNERVEWMDNDPPAFDVTRVAEAGPDGAGLLYADPRLLGAALRRVALTLQPGGWVKAHTSSDRFDIHAKMEDRACDWVEGARRYVDSSGRTDLIKEIWPALTAQMDYFLARRTARGLVLAREWAVWGNPVAYQTCEGTALNAFVYRALGDAAYLARKIGKTADANRFEKAAQSLAKAINATLWNEAAGTYSGGYYDLATAQAAPDYRPLPIGVTNGLIDPTRHAALFALDQGVVPAERRARTVAFLMAHPPVENDIMQYAYFFNQAYALDADGQDRAVLATLRRGWSDMADNPYEAGFEALHPATGSGTSRAHLYGTFPAYFLSAFVLGVRLDAPAEKHHFLIEPRLGDLTDASGTVGTEFGPVPVSWSRSDAGGRFTVRVPKGATALLHLPVSPNGSAILESQPRAQFKRVGRWAEIALSGGLYSGSWTTGP